MTTRRRVRHGSVVRIRQVLRGVVLLMLLGAYEYTSMVGGYDTSGAEGVLLWAWLFLGALDFLEGLSPRMRHRLDWVRVTPSGLTVVAVAFYAVAVALVVDGIATPDEYLLVLFAAFAALVYSLASAYERLRRSPARHRQAERVVGLLFGAAAVAAVGSAAYLVFI